MEKRKLFGFSKPLDESEKAKAAEPHEVEFAFYDRVRRRIAEEDGVINHRMMWSTLSQAALVAAIGFTSYDTGSVAQGPKQTTYIVLSCAGMALSLLTIISVWAALWEIRSLSKLYETHTLLPASSRIRKLSTKGKFGRHVGGHLLAALLPVLMGFLWLYSYLVITGRSVF